MTHMLWNMHLREFEGMVVCVKSVAEAMNIESRKENV